MTTEQRQQKTLKVKINHAAAIQGARWCSPVGWEPANEIEGAEWLEGSWWGTDREDAPQVAGLVCFVDGEEGDVIEVPIDELRVASCGDCRVIGAVEL